MEQDKTGTQPVPELVEGPRGARHQTARDAVFATQRGALLEAIADAVCAKGLVATTVADIVSRARYSRRTFYEHFTDKSACLLEAYRTAAQLLVDRMDAERARADMADWRAQVRIGIETYVAAIVSEAHLARFVLVECRAGGPDVADARAEVYQRFSDQYVTLNRIACDQDPDARQVDPAIFHLLVAGLGDLSAELLRQDQVEQLQPLTGPLVALHETAVSGRWFQVLAAGDSGQGG